MYQLNGMHQSRRLRGNEQSHKLRSGRYWIVHQCPPGLAILASLQPRETKHFCPRVLLLRLPLLARVLEILTASQKAKLLRIALTM